MVKRLAKKFFWYLEGPIIRKTFLYVISLKKHKQLHVLRNIFKGKSGIRIGGGLRGELREYIKSARHIIDINFSDTHHSLDTKIDIIADAENISLLGNQYDFVSSSHVLEHLPNPIKALHEWKRVLKEGGFIYCGVPDKRFTFDYKRQRTRLKHLIEDYKNNATHHNKTHHDDFIENWDKRMDTVWNTRRELIDNIVENPYAIHRHVWIKDDLVELFNYVELDVLLAASTGRTIHILARK